MTNVFLKSYFKIKSFSQEPNILVKGTLWVIVTKMPKPSENKDDFVNLFLTVMSAERLEQWAQLTSTPLSHSNSECQDHSAFVPLKSISILIF